MSIDAKVAEYDVKFPPGIDFMDLIFLRHDTVHRLIEMAGGVGKPIAEQDYFRGLDESQQNAMKLGLNNAMFYGGIVRKTDGSASSIVLTESGMEAYQALIKRGESLAELTPQPQKA